MRKEGEGSVCRVHALMTQRTMSRYRIRWHVVNVLTECWLEFSWLDDESLLWLLMREKKVYSNESKNI